MTSIAQALAAVHLPDSDSAALDAELLLAAVLGKTRTYLRTWPEQTLDDAQAAAFAALLARRQQGEPVAYLLGSQGFWSLDLEVAVHTLIPRPDTEVLVETALTLALPSSTQALDLGTGTGAIALALAKERPQWQVLGLDRVPEAVALAARNAQRNGLGNASFRHSDWFSALAPASRFDLIVSNPPYIAESDPHLALGDVRFEPRSALVAAADGLADLQHIIKQAPAWLKPGGWLLLEHGWDQAQAVCALLSEQGFTGVRSEMDLGGHARVSLGQYTACN
ncbi:peptide chain release factor N(5)-glutamine methyltransferase [Atopomonas sediminilitoris]|uniref:peptide chain release factor N(5)-glutamine methyltransferase n=1 Tax=Atopomonas sediminilitoris TaxID=2919919 RepID=UPI001F4D9AEE|nr:peptide chain release factor N(5)-glutamine methyltransferase [Atopomonas sediminilitoris]MCJ8169637.1 peptide chain release factor N(5)-glutamine methyltransferase [Atopomonas sediminilitoris]